MNVIDFKYDDVLYLFLETNSNTCKECHCKIYEKDKYIIVRNYYLDSLEYYLICNRCVYKQTKQKETIMKYVFCGVLFIVVSMLCYFQINDDNFKLI